LKQGDNDSSAELLRCEKELCECVFRVYNTCKQLFWFCFDDI